MSLKFMKDSKFSNRNEIFHMPGWAYNFPFPSQFLHICHLIQDPGKTVTPSFPSFPSWSMVAQIRGP